MYYYGLSILHLMIRIFSGVLDKTLQAQRFFCQDIKVSVTKSLQTFVTDAFIYFLYRSCFVIKPCARSVAHVRRNKLVDLFVIGV